MQLYELGGDTWSSPAMGGRGTVLDCFYFSIFRVLSVKCEALTSNSWFVRTRDDKGLQNVPATCISMIMLLWGRLTPLCVKKKYFGSFI
jgi:hypothetical protein